MEKNVTNTLGPRVVHTKRREVGSYQSYFYILLQRINANAVHDLCSCSGIPIFLPLDGQSEFRDHYRVYPI